jgi:hypothetical protein
MEFFFFSLVVDHDDVDANMNTATTRHHGINTTFDLVASSQ